MKNTIKRKLALLLIVATTFNSMVLPAWASEISTIEESENLYGYVNESSVTSYMNSAEEITSITVGNDIISYYYGSLPNNLNYMVVEETNGFSFAVYNDDRSYIEVNGIELNTSIASTIQRNSNELLSRSTWTYFDTQTFQASVGGLAISVGVGLLGLAATPAQQVISYFLGVFASGVFGTGYTLTEEVDRYTGNVNASLGTFDMKNVCKVYGGPASNIYEHLAHSWITIQTRYS